MSHCWHLLVFFNEKCVVTVTLLESCGLGTPLINDSGRCERWCNPTHIQSAHVLKHITYYNFIIQTGWNSEVRRMFHWGSVKSEVSEKNLGMKTETWCGEKKKRCIYSLILPGGVLWRICFRQHCGFYNRFEALLATGVKFCRWRPEDWREIGNTVRVGVWKNNKRMERTSETENGIVWEKDWKRMKNRAW